MTDEFTAVIPVGDSCYCLQLTNKLHRDINRRILSIYHQIKHQAQRPCGVLDVVPAYSSLGVHFDPIQSNPDEIKAWMLSLAEGEQSLHEVPKRVGQSYTVEVVYDGPDLERVAEHAALSVAEVVHRHSQPVYTVAMIGFRPHFPYLLGLDAALACPRQERPRAQVPGGSVAIGGLQTGIYPGVSPGGWNLIGHTDALVCRELKPGDEIRFVKKSLE